MKAKATTVLKKSFIDSVIDVFFPPICHICDELLPDGRRIICIHCWQKISIFDAKPDKSLQRCSFDKLYVLFNFDETIRLLIHFIKYKRYLTLARYFANEAERQFPEIKNQSYDAIVPVPLYKTRQRERGYNQSEEIAKALGDIFNIPVKSELLLRKRNTASQTKMSREERERNVKGAFESIPGVCEGRILLVDDVVTTGSTTEACIQALKSAGADLVDIFTIAHPLSGETDSL
jgi:ComF family protein